jgi:hypothetical protein
MNTITDMIKEQFSLIRNKGRNLTRSEINLVLSLERQFDAKKWLSKDQIKLLKEYEPHTGNDASGFRTIGANPAEP